MNDCTSEMPIAISQRRVGRPPGQGEPLKKKDFRIPVRLLVALRAVADEEGATDTQIILELLQSDSRIQKKLEEVRV